LTEDRKQLGLLLELSIRENASIAHVDEISRFWIVDRKRERGIVDQYLGGLKLRAGSWEQPVSSLSGGNQQKVLLARWLATKAKVLMFDEPTRGVDVGAKAEIYKVIGDLAAEGLGVVVVSSYLPEVLGLADRVLVMREGTVAGELPAAGATEETCCTWRGRRWARARTRRRRTRARPAATARRHNGRETTCDSRTPRACSPRSAACCSRRA
jgi:rhamnose transport system ATP-binding protein